MSFMKATFCALGLLASFTVQAASTAPTRIVVVPFFQESGTAVSSSTRRHHRRVVRFINSELTRAGFEVINPTAAGLNDAEYNALLRRARRNSSAAALDLNQRFGTDLSYIVWLSARTERTQEGLCRARVNIEGEGYDSAGRDLGAAVQDRIEVTRKHCENALADAEMELGNRVGRTLARSSGPTVVPATRIVNALKRSDCKGPDCRPPSIDIVIHFDFDSDRIRSESYPQVEQLAQALDTSTLLQSAIRIEGHTDHVGSERYNCGLSQRRAASVKRMLAAEFGVSIRRLYALGYGEYRPVESNATVAGRAHNRRVTVVNLDAVDPTWERRWHTNPCEQKTLK